VILFGNQIHANAGTNSNANTNAQQEEQHVSGHYFFEWCFDFMIPVI